MQRLYSILMNRSNPEKPQQHIDLSKPLKSMPHYVTLREMNNKIAGVLFFFLLIQAALASEIKAMVGMNSNKYLFSGEINSLNRQQKTGFGLGLGWAFNLNRNIKLEINALYSQKGAKASIAYDSGQNGFRFL